MPGKKVYEYAVIRLVPRVEREEFLNVGVIVYCRENRFLEVKIEVNQGRLQAFATETDGDEIQAYLQVWDWICRGDLRGGPMAKLDPAGRFRWLTAVRSTIVQASRVHPGLTDDPQSVLNQLFDQYVR
ncbi:MAG: DUF3037 domain-containing protein [Bacteroidota bacterium]